MSQLNKILEIQRIVKNPFGEYNNLSKREKLVGKLAVYGYWNNEIAEMTDISLGSVNVYMQKICIIADCPKEKLGGWILEKIKAIVEDSSEVHS